MIKKIDKHQCLLLAAGLVLRSNAKDGLGANCFCYATSNDVKSEAECIYAQCALVFVKISATIPKTMRAGFFGHDKIDETMFRSASDLRKLDEIDSWSLDLPQPWGVDFDDVVSAETWTGVSVMFRQTQRVIFARKARVQDIGYSVRRQSIGVNQFFTTKVLFANIENF